MQHIVIPHCLQVITVVSVTDADKDEENVQVEYEILPSDHSHLFELAPRGQDCDVLLTRDLDADVTSNETVATVVYSIMVGETSYCLLLFSYYYLLISSHISISSYILIYLAHIPVIHEKYAVATTLITRLPVPLVCFK